MGAALPNGKVLVKQEQTVPQKTNYQAQLFWVGKRRKGEVRAYRFAGDCKGMENLAG